MRTKEQIIEQIDRIYSKMLPIINGEKPGAVDDTEFWLIENIWISVFNLGKDINIDEYTDNILDNIEKNIPV